MPYKSTIKSRPFLFLETQKIAGLFVQGYDEKQIKEYAITQNIVQMNADARIKEVTNVIIKRLQVLDEPLQRMLISKDIQSGKYIVLYAILKTDRLFFEFMNEVFREKAMLQDYHLTKRDFHNFFESKRQQSEKVANWKDYTFYKLEQVYVRILFEAGLLKNHRTDREITIPLLTLDVSDHLQDIDNSIYLKAMMGGKTS